MSCCWSGGPPCQPVSGLSLAPQGFDDPRGEPLLTFKTLKGGLGLARILVPRAAPPVAVRGSCQRVRCASGRGQLFGGRGAGPSECGDWGWAQRPRLFWGLDLGGLKSRPGLEVALPLSRGIAAKWANGASLHGHTFPASVVVGRPLHMGVPWGVGHKGGSRAWVRLFRFLSGGGVLDIHVVFPTPSRPPAAHDEGRPSCVQRFPSRWLRESPGALRAREHW